MTKATNSTWDAGLPELNIDALQPIFAPSGDKDKPRQLAQDRKLIRRTDKAVMLDARRLANAIESLARLPAEGEVFHCVTEKRYSMMHIIPAVLHLAAPATIRYLAIVTLSFSRANLVDLLNLIDSGQIQKIDFTYSCYFRSNNREQCESLASELTTRGGRVFSGLIHAKILLIELSDGRHFVVESSANLRSCASLEQITLFHDASLFEFHKGWIGEVMEGQPR